MPPPLWKTRLRDTGFFRESVELGAVVGQHSPEHSADSVEQFNRASASIGGNFDHLEGPSGEHARGFRLEGRAKFSEGPDRRRAAAKHGQCGVWRPDYLHAGNSGNWWRLVSFRPCPMRPRTLAAGLHRDSGNRLVDQHPGTGENASGTCSRPWRPGHLWCLPRPGRREWLWRGRLVGGNAWRENSRRRGCTRAIRWVAC
jgi:hypothetical protein